MERAKRNTHGMTKCIGCGRFVKNIRRHLAQTQCSIIANRNPLNNDANRRNSTDIIIGSNIGFQIDYDPPNNQTNSEKYTIPSRNPMLAHQCRVPKSFKIQATNFNDLPMPDFQSISVLSVKTGEQTADIHHTQLRQLNQHLKYKTIACNGEDDNEDDDSDTISSFNNKNNEEFINDNATLSSSIELQNNSNISTNVTYEDTINDSNGIIIGNLNLHPYHKCYERLTSKGFKAYGRIYDLLQKSQVPLYRYDEIIDTIGKEVHNKNIDPYDPEYTRRTFLKDMCKKFSTAEPQVISVHLDTRWNDKIHSNDRLARDTVEVIVFDFKTQLMDLFEDKTLFGNIDNLVVNKDINNPESKWKPYQNNTW